jgi:hypothetical protein
MPNRLNSAPVPALAGHEGVQEQAGELDGQQDRGRLALEHAQHARTVTGVPDGPAKVQRRCLPGLR